MKRRLLVVALVMIGFAMVACSGEPPKPCTDDSACEEGLVCNKGYGLYEYCQQYIGYLEMLPIPIPIPPVCTDVPIGADIGTCQAPGEAGFPCAEGADCVSEICTEGFCEQQEA